MLHLKSVCILISLIGGIDCLNLCGDWTQYKDIKCIKILEINATEEEALNNCTHIEKTSTLISIHSKDEQNFINHLLDNKKNFSNAWIGMKDIDQYYRWIDGTDTNYTNWSDHAVKDGTQPCVQMSLSNEIGKWLDVPCKNPALIICQKKHEMSFNSFKTLIESLTKNMEKNNEKINALETSSKQLIDEITQLKATYIPLGFVFTQLPNQSLPQQLWPNMNWTEVTQQYSGLFFRVEGGGSDAFGVIQPANFSRISNIMVNSVAFDNHGYTSMKTAQLIEGHWSGNLNQNTALSTMNIYTDSGENRPRNTAIKIWKRI